MISGSNELLQKQLEYTLLKPDCHRWWISKMQSGHEDTLEEWYAIKLCFKLGKNATETYAMLLTAFGASWMNRASVFEWHKRFKEGRERGVGRVRKSIHQSWLAKGLRLGLLCWGFKVVQEKIPLEEANTLLEFHVCTINKSAHTKKSGNLFNDPRKTGQRFTFQCFDLQVS